MDPVAESALALAEVAESSGDAAQAAQWYREAATRFAARQGTAAAPPQPRWFRREPSL